MNAAPLGSQVSRTVDTAGQSNDRSTGPSFQAEDNYREPTWPTRRVGRAKMLHLDIKVDDLDTAVEHAIASVAPLAESRP